MQSSEPETHDKVLDNYLDRNSIWKCQFLRRGENRTTQRETSPSNDENQPLTKHYDAENGIEPGPHSNRISGITTYMIMMTRCAPFSSFFMLSQA